MATLSPQAQNSLDLYRGNPASTIKRALYMQRSSIVSELMEYCHASSLDDLALKLQLRMF